MAAVLRQPIAADGDAVCAVASRSEPLAQVGHERSGVALEPGELAEHGGHAQRLVVAKVSLVVRQLADARSTPWHDRNP